MKRDTDDFQFQITDRQPLYEGFYRMEQIRLQHQTFSGGEMQITRELMDRPDAVCVLLVDFQQDRLVLIEQFRVGALRESNPWLIEIVAGLIDKDETPEQVARREAIEEAGVDIGRMEQIARYLPSAGGTNERIFLYIGEVDSRKASGIHGLPHEGEDIRVLTPTLAEAQSWLAEGRITNAACIIALQWLQLNAQRLRTQWSTPDR